MWGIYKNVKWLFLLKEWLCIIRGYKSQVETCFPNKEESNPERLLIYLCSSHAQSVALRSEALVIAWNVSLCSEIHCSALPERKAEIFSCRTSLSVEQRDMAKFPCIILLKHY